MRTFAFLTGAALLALTVPAKAHGYLESSFPAAKTHFYTSPHEIKLRFSVRADAKYSKLELRKADGELLKSKIQPQASRDFDMETPTLSPGRYQVQYCILSPDGDILRGEVNFVVD